jgi:serine/threonine-protein kinase ATR
MFTGCSLDVHWMQAHKAGSKFGKEAQQVATKLNTAIEAALAELPTYQWYTALPQLTSRICHEHPVVLGILKQILIRVVGDFPQQALWSLAAVLRSKIPARQKHAHEVVASAKRLNPKGTLRDVAAQFQALIDQLEKLCNAAPNLDERNRVKPFSVKRDFSHLKRMMPVQVMVPVQNALTAMLPADGRTDPSHAPFAANMQVMVEGLVDEVEVMSSLQRPKKMAVMGSDGREYVFLAKPKDDLRKDSRMMEFNCVLNRLLTKDPASRRRNLYIKTFAVIPLTEDCGLVQWVPNTRGIRHILQDLYEASGQFVRRGPQATHVRIKGVYDAYPKASERMAKLLPTMPPVFHKWLLTTFPEPATWVQSRASFAHTAAVWSMVGHIVGLGDRHGENILLCATTGDVVHVDFSCLFDKGMDLECPECVPFRLTQNIVDGLGIAGTEGVFIRVCEIVLEILRNHRETLMTVLETFVHDPLLEWYQRKQQHQSETKSFAQRALDKIQWRLEGKVVGVGAAPSLPLAPRGQARRLVDEATDWDNLGRMYIWWMPWF